MQSGFMRNSIGTVIRMPVCIRKLQMFDFGFPSKQLETSQQNVIFKNNSNVMMSRIENILDMNENWLYILEL